jgi:hypothetical protein
MATKAKNNLSAFFIRIYFYALVYRGEVNREVNDTPIRMLYAIRIFYLLNR